MDVNTCHSSGSQEIRSEDVVTEYTVLLGCTEIGFGSIVHGLRIPMGGHALSVNQGIVLTLAAKKCSSGAEAAKYTNTISIYSSILKSLSPAGKKLTPMLALSCQGILFSFGFLFQIFNCCFWLLFV